MQIWFSITSSGPWSLDHLLGEYWCSKYYKGNTNTYHCEYPENSIEPQDNLCNFSGFRGETIQIQSHDEGCQTKQLLEVTKQWGRGGWSITGVRAESHIFRAKPFFMLWKDLFTNRECHIYSRGALWNCLSILGMLSTRPTPNWVDFGRELFSSYYK